MGIVSIINSGRSENAEIISKKMHLPDPLALNSHRDILRKKQAQN